MSEMYSKAPIYEIDYTLLKTAFSSMDARQARLKLKALNYLCQKQDSQSLALSGDEDEILKKAWKRRSFRKGRIGGDYKPVQRRSYRYSSAAQRRMSRIISWTLKRAYGISAIKEACFKTFGGRKLSGGLGWPFFKARWISLKNKEGSAPTVRLGYIYIPASAIDIVISNFESG
jgi:hypothetical protein